ncbi:unnamed protein product [Cylindrotheca closterium]|uniref:Uncharacterized protein n=1 Tax=Cylindrotheca closterium TaxID=2856 RepID=A0AAD2FQ99_9STRA|nr:unnamed protein product [Cylindrotheca closterium]
MMRGSRTASLDAAKATALTTTEMKFKIRMRLIDSRFLDLLQSVPKIRSSQFNTQLPQWEAIVSSVDDHSAGENDNSFVPPVFEPWGDGDHSEPAFWDEDVANTFVNFSERDSHSNELNDTAGQDNDGQNVTQDERNSRPQYVVDEEPKDELLDQSFLPDVEGNLVQSIGENSEELGFLDSHGLDSAIDSLGKDASHLATGDHGHMDQPASPLSEASSSSLEQQANSTIDLDTEELYADLASLDLTTLKDPPVYSDEVKNGAQNPDPILLANLEDEGESDDDDEAETQPLDVALQSHREHNDLAVQGPSSIFQVDDDPGDPMCSITIPASDVQKKNHDHHGQQKDDKDSGFISQDGSSTRREAWAAAQCVLKTYGLVEGFPKKERQCEGHKDTIFGVSFSECGSYCATASQDSTIKVWDVRNKTLLATLEGHSKDFECLRVAWASHSWSNKVLDRNSNFKYLLASSGADGTVRLWACQDPRITPGQKGGWQCYLTLDHSQFAVKRTSAAEAQDKPQIYTLDFINHWEAFDTSGEDSSPSSFLITCSDDYLHFWTLDGLSTLEPTCPDRLTLKEVISLKFGSIGQYGYGVSVTNVTVTDHSTTTLEGDNADSAGNTFGGDRNPNNVVYVFDASFCPANGLVGVALSDGTLRLINGRGICVCILCVANSQSHLKSFCWDRNGSRLVTTVATGQLVSWELRLNDEAHQNGYTKADHVCTFEGGHAAGRPLFGARYYGGDTEELILSWSVDGSLCLWDSQSHGHVKSPIAVLRQYDHSIYAVEVHANQSTAVGGAESDCCSHGVPLYLEGIQIPALTAAVLLRNVSSPLDSLHAVSLPKEEEDKAPLSPKTTQTSETVAVVSPPSSPTFDFDHLVQQIEPFDGTDPISEIDPFAWDLGDDVESLVLDDDELAALWDIGESTSFEPTAISETVVVTQSHATPTEQVPEINSSVEEETVDAKTEEPQEKEPEEAVSETKTDNNKEEEEGKKEKPTGPQQQKQGTDGLPSYLYCQPIAKNGVEDSPPPWQEIPEETKESSSTLNREKLLGQLAGLGLESLSQLALYSDRLKGTDQDNLLSILEEVTGIGNTERDLLDLDAEDLFTELSDLGFGGLAEIAREASYEPSTLICQPCAPKPIDPTSLTKEEEKEESIKPAADTRVETKEEPESSTIPPPAKEETGGIDSKSTNSPASKKGDVEKDKSKIDERLQIQQQKLDMGTETAPKIVELQDDIGGKPKARRSDGPSQPPKKPRPIPLKPTTSVTEEVEQERTDKGNGEKTQSEEAKTAESVRQQAALRMTSQMFTPGRTISVKDDLEKEKSQKQDDRKPVNNAQQPPAQPSGKGAPSKNEAFLARLQKKEADIQKRDQEELQERPPLHVTDAFKGCTPCIPNNFRIISTKEPEEKSTDSDSEAPTEAPSQAPPQAQNDDITASQQHPQLRDNPSAPQQEEHQQYDGHEQQFQNYNPARPEAWDVADGLLKTFGLFEGCKKKEQSCFGHKEKIFGVSFSECGNFCASASQDSTINVWDVKKNSLLTSLKGHSKAYECLRVVWASPTWSSHSLDRTSNFKYLLASSGADGTVRFWACKDPRIKQGVEGSWHCCLTFDHAEPSSQKQSEVDKELGAIAEDEEKEEEEDKDNDKPQVYSLQFIDHWQAFNNKMDGDAQNSFFMTSSDDYVHFWELEIKSGMEQVLTMGEDQEISLKLRPDEMGLKEVFSLHFGDMNQYFYGVEIVNVTKQGLGIGGGGSGDHTNDSSPAKAFGGERNPDKKVYVFDASYCPAIGLLGVALSDGSLRLHNGRGHCVSVMNLPGVNSHLTSFSWDRSGERLVTTVATGHLISWHVHFGDVQGNGNAKAECMAIMEGGHAPGRPIFGAKYLGGEYEHLIVSWGIDGSLCLWDSYLQGNVQSPMSVLKQDDEYPIYAVDVHREKQVLAVAGGTDGGFIGTPLYLYNYKEMKEKKKEEKKSQEKKQEPESSETKAK